MFPGRFRRDPQAGSAPLAPLTLTLAGFLLAGCTADRASTIGIGQVSRTTVTEVVEAPAAVVARASVAVAAPSAGTVAELKVTDGQRVTRGQVLLRLDSPSARQALESARAADVRTAGAGAVSLPRLDVSDLNSDLNRSDAAATKAFAEARAAATAIPDPRLRARALAGVAAAEADYRAVQAQVRRTGAQVNSSLANLGQLASSLSQAQRAQTRAAVSAAQASVDALTVRAPIGGTIVLGGAAPAAGGSADLSAVLGQLPSSVASQARSAAGRGAGSTGGAGTGAVGGTVNTTTVEVGTPVAAGGALLTITDVSTLSLLASVDETDVLLVKPGVTATVELDAVPGTTYPATVRSVDLQPAASSRGGVSYGVRLALGAGRTGSVGGAPTPRPGPSAPTPRPGPSAPTPRPGPSAPTPRPGMSAVARLTVRAAPDAVSVPSSAVVRDGARDAVWVVEDGTAHRRFVRLGAQGDDVVQVTAGVEVGRSIVVRGADRVTEGQRVGPR